MTTYITICYKPLTYITPAFYGTGVALVSYSYPHSRLIPSIYTVAGAVLNLLSNITDYEFEELEKLVLEDKLRIYGVYIKAHYGDEELNLVPLLAVRSEGTITPPKVCRENVVSYIPPAKPIDKPRDAKLVLALVRLTTEGADISRIYELNVEVTHRVGVAINRNTRTVLEPGSLYGYTGIARYVICRSGNCTEDVSFCVDLEIEEDKFSARLIERVRNIRIIAQDFGGEQSVAEPYIELRRTPPVLISLAKGRTTQVLAVSHIAVKELDNGYKVEYVTLRGEKIEAFIGRMELLTGWLARMNRPKTPILTLAPGTIYWSKEIRDEHRSAEWWQKLLTTAVPLKNPV